MRVLTVGLLSCVLLTSAGCCTRQQVNSVSMIRYEEADGAGEIALKTAGNLPPWIMGAPLYAVDWIGRQLLDGIPPCPCAAFLAGISFRR